MARRLRGDAGQAAIVLLGAAFIILVVAGLAVDGASLVTAKIGLQADADAAARTGAGALNQGRFLSGGGAVALDTGAADSAARSYIATACPSCTVAVTAGADAVTVTLHRSEPTFFLQMVGLGSFTVAGTATANPVGNR